MATLETFVIGKGSITLYSNLEFFDKLKEYAINILGLKNITVGEPRISISGETCSTNWNKSINAKIGSDETCDESDFAWELVDEKWTQKENQHRRDSK